MYVSELIVFLRGHNILCIAEVLCMFMNFMNSFISVYDDAYVSMHACACSYIHNLNTYIYITFYFVDRFGFAVRGMSCGMTQQILHKREARTHVNCDREINVLLVVWEDVSICDI